MQCNEVSLVMLLPLWDVFWWLTCHASYCTVLFL
jgi:hypothetical protein